MSFIGSARSSDFLVPRYKRWTTIQLLFIIGLRQVNKLQVTGVNLPPGTDYYGQKRELLMAKIN